MTGSDAAAVIPLAPTERGGSVRDASSVSVLRTSLRLVSQTLRPRGDAGHGRWSLPTRQNCSQSSRTIFTDWSAPAKGRRDITQQRIEDVRAVVDT